MKRIIAIIFLISFYTNITGQSKYLYKGTIGNHPIVMIIEYIDSNVNARYYYNKYLHDIYLESLSFNDSNSINLIKKEWNNKLDKEGFVEQFSIHKINKNYGLVNGKITRRIL